MMGEPTEEPASRNWGSPAKAAMSRVNAFNLARGMTTGGASGNIRDMRVLPHTTRRWPAAPDCTKIFVDSTKPFVYRRIMALEILPKPTESELELLRVLWDIGPSTVREVHEKVSEKKPAGYTTVLKLLQIMTEKGLVRRDEQQRAHVYAARLAREQTQRQLLGDLIDRAFGGSASRLVMSALASGQKSTPQELAEIRSLLDRLERGTK